MQESLKEKVRQEVYYCAKLYKEKLVDVEYLIYSRQFQHKKFYCIQAKEDNFLHLTGLVTALKAGEFFQACLLGTLELSDFELGDKGRKGTIRRKLAVLRKAILIFESADIMMEEDFRKNQISCAFATSDNACTLGFTKTKLAKPQTVLKGNHLQKAYQPDLILRKIETSGTSWDLVYNPLDLSWQEVEELVDLLNS